MAWHQRYRRAGGGRCQPPTSRKACRRIHARQAFLCSGQPMKLLNRSSPVRGLLFLQPLLVVIACFIAPSAGIVLRGLGGEDAARAVLGSRRLGGFFSCRVVRSTVLPGRAVGGTISL